MNQRGSGLWGSIPTVTKNLVIINAICWFAEIVFAKRGIDLTEILGLHFVISENFKIYQFITYMFLHDPNSISHLFFNMFALFMLGPIIENYWGEKKFLIYYMSTGIGAGIVQMIVYFIHIKIIESGLSTDSIYMVHQNGLSALLQNKNFVDPTLAQLNILLNTPTIGASGAIFGILLAFGMLFPNARLMLLFPPIPMKAKWFVIAYGAIELFFGVSGIQGNVAHFAHLGGMLFGIILILYWKKNDKTNNSNGNFF